VKIWCKASGPIQPVSPMVQCIIKCNL